MSKFRCACGHIVVDNGRFDHIKGHISRAQSFGDVYEKPCATVAEYVRAVVKGKRKEWIEDFYGRSYFDIEDSSVVFDIFNYARLGSDLDIYQCEKCGRIFIEREPRQSSGALRSFKPE